MELQMSFVFGVGQKRLNKFTGGALCLEELY